MEEYKLVHPVSVFYVEAASFPKGIKAAFDKLNAVTDMTGRQIFGLSKPYNGLIRYRAAAAEKFDGEAAQLGYPNFIIQAGNYLGETLTNWQQNEMLIMSIFNRIIADSRLDGSAHCVEWYKSDTELLCLALMKPDANVGRPTLLNLSNTAS